MVLGIGAFTAMVALLVGAVVSAPSPAADELEAGACFDDPETDSIVEVSLIDCAQPHDYEVVGSVVLDGEDFPGNEAAVDEARIACEPVFRGYTGFDRGGTAWLLNALTPTSEGWAAGNRTGTCLAFQFDEDLEFRKIAGSIRRPAA